MSREGQILLAVWRNPFLTIAELAKALSMSEKTISRSMTSLVGANCLRRTKVMGVHSYEVVKGTIERHPDIRDIAQLVLHLGLSAPQKEGDITHEAL